MRLLAFTEGPAHVCFRYRIQAFEAALAQAGWSLHEAPLEQSAFARWRQFRQASDYDAVILQRRLLPAWQLQLLRKYARRLVFDFDDAVLYRDSYSRKGPYSRRRAGRFARTVALADCVIAGNSFLADCAMKADRRSQAVQVIPTCIELTKYPYNSHEGAAVSDALVWIGSSSTLNGLEQDRSLWERIGGAVPGLTMRIICDRFPEFRGVSVVKIPWSEQTETRELAASGIGIGLLPDGPWSRGKCGLKILQYQAAGLPVIANPVGAHRQMVSPGRNGYLPATADEWVSAVRETVLDSDLRLEMGRAGRAQVESAYSTAVWADAFVTAVTGGSRGALANRGGHNLNLMHVGKLASTSK